MILCVWRVFCVLSASYFCSGIGESEKAVLGTKQCEPPMYITSRLQHVCVISVASEYFICGILVLLIEVSAIFTCFILRCILRKGSIEVHLC